MKRFYILFKTDCSIKPIRVDCLRSHTIRFNNRFSIDKNFSILILYQKYCDVTILTKESIVNQMHLRFSINFKTLLSTFDLVVTWNDLSQKRIGLENGINNFSMNVKFCLCLETAHM